MPHRRVAVTVADAIRAPEARPLVLLSDYLILACLRLAPFVPAIFLLVTYGVSLVDSLVTFDLSASPRLGDSMSGNRLHPIVFSYLFGLSGIYLNAVLSAFCNAAVGKQSWHMWAIMTICVMINFGVFVLVAVFVSFSSPFLYILLILFVSSCIAMPSTYRRFEDGALWLRLAKSFGAPLLGGIIGLCIDLINIGCIMLGSGMGGQSAIVQVLANGLIYPIIRWPVYHMAAYMHRLLTLNEEDHDALDYEHVRKRMVMHVIAEGMYFEASGTIAILKTADYGTFLASMALRKCLLLALRVFKLKRALDAARKQKSQVAPDVGGSLRGLASYGTEQSGMNYNYNTAGVSNPASDDRSSDPYMPHRVSRSQTFGRKASVRVEEIIKTVGRLSSYIGIQASRAVDIDTYPLHYDEVSPMQDRSLATQAQAASNSTPISSTESPTAGVNYSYVATTTTTTTTTTTASSSSRPSSSKSSTGAAASNAATSRLPPLYIPDSDRRSTGVERQSSLRQPWGDAPLSPIDEEDTRFTLQHSAENTPPATPLVEFALKRTWNLIARIISNLCGFFVLWVFVDPSHSLLDFGLRLLVRIGVTLVIDVAFMAAEATWFGIPYNEQGRVFQ